MFLVLRSEFQVLCYRLPANSYQPIIGAVTASASSVSAPSVRPLLKWAGGKRQLLHALGAYYPARFTRYVEPFFGSGAVFFDLLNQGRLRGIEVKLADVNPDLIGAYSTLRDDAAAVIDALEALAADYRRRGAEAYYDVRDLRFNPLRAADGRYTPELTAMLIFLNRTGFNGLFRLNSRGGFNVPAGRYTDPRICDPNHLLSVARAFGTPGVAIELRSFEATLADARAGDFVYCDPPYAPLSRTANFASYTAGGFTALDQLTLQRAVIGACARGAQVVVSNSSAPEICTAYTTAEARLAGLKVTRVPARRAINSRASARGPVDELIISNVSRQKLRMAKAGPSGAKRRIAVGGRQ
jgi:DNA adenine methylase